MCTGSSPHMADAQLWFLLHKTTNGEGDKGVGGLWEVGVEGVAGSEITRRWQVKGTGQNYATMDKIFRSKERKERGANKNRARTRIKGYVKWEV